MSGEESVHDARTARAIALSRLIIGALQGAALYWLYRASDTHAWPATDGLIFAPALLAALFIPLGVSLSLGNLRTATLALWTATATLAVAAVAIYAIWKGAPLDWRQVESDVYVSSPHIVPPFGVFFFTAIWLFIAHALVAGGDADRRLIADYRTHFDVAWKLAVQLGLGAAFVGVFWGLLWLGAELFDLINLDFLQKLIEHEWFAIPATALATAAAVHLTDVRVGLVRGVRTLVLVLLGWFLPLLALLVAGFLAALLFTGLAPLWQTRHAAADLLVAAAILVILINAAYQDGSGERRPPLVVRYAGILAACALVPLVAIAAYALNLRVAEYGWTADRVATAACILIAACYAAGYAFAALSFRNWLKPIERWNFASAILILLVLTAIFSPAADPDRIAVASQVARLEIGAVAPDKFDFQYLRWRSGRYGVSALEQLAKTATGKFAKDIRAKAAQLLVKKTSYQLPPKAGATDIAANVTVYPKGRSLPADLLRQDWNKEPYPDLFPACLRRRGMTCDAFLLAMASDGATVIVILNDSQQGAVLAKDGAGIWREAGLPGPLWTCPAVIAGLRAGQMTITPPAPRWRDVTVKGAALTVIPGYDQTPSCPK